MATRPNRPKGRSIKNLRMVWGFTSRYPGHIAIAALALLVAAAATSGVPYAFKLIIDKGFAAGSGRHEIDDLPQPAGRLVVAFAHRGVEEIPERWGQIDEAG